MSYLFTPPDLMRVFETLGPKSTALCLTDKVVDAGETVELVSAAAMSYDHDSKLALVLDDGSCLLLEEIGDDDVAELAFQWSDLHVESSQGPSVDARQVATAALETLTQELSLFMREYVRPGLQVVDDAPPLVPTAPHERGARFVTLF